MKDYKDWKLLKGSVKRIKDNKKFNLIDDYINKEIDKYNKGFKRLLPKIKKQLGVK